MLLIVTAADVFLVIFAGVLFAILLRSVADLIDRHTPLSAGWSLALVLVVLALLIGSAAYFLAAEIASQLDQLTQSIAKSWQELRGRLGNEAWGRQLLTMMSGTPASGQELLSHASRIFSTTLGAVGNVAVVLFIGIYLAADPEWYRRGLLRLFPRNERARGAEVLDAIGTTLRWWLIGRFASMFVVGVATTVGLMRLGIPLALALGSVAFLFDFVPFFGPLFAAVPALLFGLTIGTAHVIYVIALYSAIQIVEGYVLTPLIEQRSVRLPPALTIGMVVLFGLLAGIPGILLATPLTAALVVLIDKFYVEDALEDDRAVKPVRLREGANTTDGSRSRIEFCNLDAARSVELAGTSPFSSLWRTRWPQPNSARQQAGTSRRRRPLHGKRKRSRTFRRQREARLEKRARKLPNDRAANPGSPR
jgi:predicted PurR-regulated permease PerM